MPDSFGTIGFTALAAGMTREQGAEISVQHIPGGSVNYIDYGGLLPRQMGYTLLLSSPDYLALELLVGGTAQLVTAVDGTVSSAALLSLARNLHVPGGTTFAAAVFLVVTP